MSIQEKFRSLKRLSFNNTHVHLVLVGEYKKERVSHYTLKYVPIETSLESKLKRIVHNKITSSNSFEEYTLDCPEPESDLVRTMPYEETDFIKILEQLRALNPEEDKISSVDDLLTAKAYLIIIRTNSGIKTIGFKKLEENWKMKQKKDLIYLLFQENRFNDLEDQNIFSISGTVDFIYYDEILFILSKKNFEQGLNFREGMIEKANLFYAEVESQDRLKNIDLLKNRVGNNQRYLRKLATVKNLGHYNNPAFIAKVKELNASENWGLTFDNDILVITEESIDDILTVLSNKRLKSELTNEIFDVESAKLKQFQIAK